MSLEKMMSAWAEEGSKENQATGRDESQRGQGGRARRRAARRGRDEKQRMLHAGRHRAPGHGRGAPGFRAGAPSRVLDLLLPCLSPRQLGSPQDRRPRRCPALAAPGARSTSSGRHPQRCAPGNSPAQQPATRKTGESPRTRPEDLHGGVKGTGLALWPPDRYGGHALDKTTGGGVVAQATSCRFRRWLFPPAVSET